jgi:glutamyl-tRNA synthetase
MPLLRERDKSKISKRRNPAARLTWFVEEGYLPETLRNFLALMGYSLPDGQEVFSFEEMVASFDWARVNPVGPVFDLDKLGWLNGHYIRSMPVEQLAERLIDYLGLRAPDPGDAPAGSGDAAAGSLHAAAGSGDAAAGSGDATADLVRRATPLVAERITVLREAREMLAFLLTDELTVEPDAAAKQLTAEQRPTLVAARQALEATGDWAAASIESTLREALIERLGLKPKFAFGPVRVAVTGRTVSPPLFESLELLGRDRSLRRLDEAIRRCDG